MTADKDADFLGQLEALKQKFEAIDRALSDPRTQANGNRQIELAKERAGLAEIVETYEAFLRLSQDLRSSEDILKDSGAEEELKQMAAGEVKILQEKSREAEMKLRQLLLPKDPRDDKNTFLEVRAGTGGEEAALFASELVRMYSRYAERQRWKVELVSSSPTGIGGLKEAILLVEGKSVYNRLKYESGVHRVQRVPQTEASGRTHTSAVTVAVIPEAEEIDIAVDQKDLRIDTFCASGPGGQGVNTTHSAVRITHLPTNLVVSCQDERSQLKNKGKAMRILRSRLLDLEQSRREAEIARDRKAQVGTGDRSEKIRTYNFPQNRVTDHRIGLTLHRLETILDGDIDEIIDQLIAADQAEKLKTVASAT
jgi:peptide chain release factor 1